MELVIFIGLQGSGKSTFYASQFAATHDVVGKDRMGHNRNKSSRQMELVGESLRAGRSIVVDNTNPSAADRADLLRLAREFGARAVGFYFQADVKECLARNRLRTGRQRVPDVAIFATRKKLQAPSYREGFDSLYHVRAAGGGTFEVRDWEPEEG